MLRVVDDLDIAALKGATDPRLVPPNRRQRALILDWEFDVREFSSHSPSRFLAMLGVLPQDVEPRGSAADGVRWNRLTYVWITDFAGRGAVIGSACLWTTFHMPSSSRKMVATLTETGVISSASPTRAR